MSETTEATSGDPNLMHGVDSPGAITPEDIEQRARELAKIEGRTEPNEVDLESAREDLLTIGQRIEAPETADSFTEDLTAWDESPHATGTHAERFHLEDETPPGELLVEEGIEEADHDRRVSAAEENPAEEA